MANDRPLPWQTIEAAITEYMRFYGVNRVVAIRLLRSDALARRDA